MKEKAVLDVLLNQKLGTRDFKIFGHFLEHFHRQVYGGIFDPDNPLADENGFRTDVIEALRRIKTPIIRWPGGCFVSAYHWEDGIGSNRQPSFDKHWRVEESNQFGTDEFIHFCRQVGAEPYICTNAGSGSSEEMSNWVEYCNLKEEGKWAKRRIENGHPESFDVKYWSIGNENYYRTEIGAKTAAEWGRFVRESAKMMKQVDPSLELLAASVTDIQWNMNLLQEAGDLLDWISVHIYSDPLWEENNLSPYEVCMAYTMDIEEQILKAKYILGAMGYLGKLRIAVDEWNLRGWHHPNVHSALSKEDYVTPRDKNDINSSYTMADAVYTACFLNQCLKHCDVVGMANFAPAVNTRGAIFTHRDGLVLRPTYHVFDLYANQTYADVVPTLMTSPSFEVALNEGERKQVPSLDAVVTRDHDTNQLSIVLVNRHKEQALLCRFRLLSGRGTDTVQVFTLAGESADAFNDVDQPEAVTIKESVLSNVEWANFEFECLAHSISVLKTTISH